MDGKTHPYLDIAAVAAVGETLLDARPAFVFAADGSRLIFANAAAAVLFGTACIGDALRLRFSDLNPVRQQAARLSRVLPSESARLEMLRLGQGVSLTMLPAACRRLNLAGDERAVLAVAASGDGRESIAARAERLVGAIGANDCLAAVMNTGGKVLAASSGYDALAPVETAIDALIDAAQSAPEQLAKRAIEVSGGTRSSGAVRFRAEGHDYFLLIVGPVEARATATAHIAVHAETASEAGDAAGLEVPVEMMFPPVEAEAEADAALEAEEDEAMAEAAVAEAAAPAAPLPAAPPSPVVHFVFAADGDGRFTFVSPELVATVGAKTGAVAGHRWTDIARVLGFDAAGAFSAGAFAADVAWPVEGRGTVAVSLTGGPVSTRDGRGAGYHGFGTIRPEERGIDRRAVAIGFETIAPAEVTAPVEASPPAGEAPKSPKPSQPDDGDLDSAAQLSIERGISRGRRRSPETPPSPAPVRAPREEPPALTGETTASNIVRLPGAAPVRTPPERLTGTERDAFRRIAEALGARRSEDHAPKPAESAPAASRKETAKAPTADIDTRLLDRLPIAIAVFRDRKTLFANRTLLELLGYDSYDAFVEAGGADAIFPGSEGLAGNIADAGGRLAASRRDGVTVPVKAWLHAVNWAGATALMLSLSASAARDAASEDDLAVEMARTEARADELEAILDTATDGVIVIDGRGRIGSLNHAAEALFGVNGKEYAGRYFTDLLADESQKAALDYLDGLAANGVASVLNDGREVIGRVPAGGLIPLFMNMGRIGTSDKFCAVLRDITHWKNVEEELIAARRAAEAANAQKSDFLAKISHEIRTPLNAIIGFSEVMMGERFGPIGNQRYRDYLHDIHVSGAHLLSLINDLLDLSKIEAGKLDLSFQAVPVNAAIQECVALMQPQANRERIIIRTSLSADVPNVVADQRSFRQILLNLMSNAVKFTRAGGQVIVSSSLEANGEVIVRIRDTGIGMSEKDIETALKPFRQVAVSRDDREHGTGLGLPLTKALVEANRATFAIDSAPNQGTLVKITFPTTRVLAG